MSRLATRAKWTQPILPGARAIVDVPTAIIGLVSLAVLWHYKISEPILVTISGIVGLILWPFVKIG